MSPAPQDFRSLVRSRIREAAQAAGLGEAVPDERGIILELPREPAHGDVACPVAFSLARSARKAPSAIAEAIRDRVTLDGQVERVEVAGKGYLNFFLGGEIWRDLLRAIESAGENYGATDLLKGERFLVEFVSANPTGPLVVANARHAAFGEALCRCLRAAGAEVDREYYTNDAGTQVRNLGLSVEARWREARGESAEIPADGYHGEYVAELAGLARESLTDSLLEEDPETRTGKLADFAVTEMIARQRHDLAKMRVEYDRWFHEKDMRKAGRVDQTLESLKAKGVVYDSDEAQWFAATRFGDEKDRVLVRRDGQPTYTLPDVAYHMDKYGRGYTRLVNVVGADHQTEMETLRRALEALGQDTERLEVIIVQWVNLKRGGEKTVMSKRAGNLVPLKDLLDDVGVDAARFFFLLRAPSSHLEFDLDLAKAKTLDNPVYYIQYAHARLNSLLGYAREQGVGVPAASQVPVSLLAEPETRLVLRRLARHPLMVEKAAATRAPHLLTYEVLELAQAVHQFYTRYRVVGAGPVELQGARLALVAAAKRTIANGLELLGVSAPERM